MRGADTFTENAFTVHHLDDFVPSNYPLRPICQMVNAALVKMDGLFAGMHEADIKGGRPSIAPEKLLRAMLLQVFYSIRSDRQLMEQVEYNLLYRWFIGLAMNDAVLVPPTVFTKSRERLIEQAVVIELFNHVRQSADKRGWLLSERFSVDGMLIQAWAGHKSFVRKGCSDDDHGGGSFKGQTLSDNRHRLIASAVVTCADGCAEHEATKSMIFDVRQVAPDVQTEITLGADKGDDAKEFIEACLETGVIPHVAQNTSGGRWAVPEAIAQTDGRLRHFAAKEKAHQARVWLISLYTSRNPISGSSS
jgi:transposase